MLLVRPVMVSVVVLASLVLSVKDKLLELVPEYISVWATPVPDAAVQLNVICPLPAVAVVFVGALTSGVALVVVIKALYSPLCVFDLTP